MKLISRLAVLATAVIIVNGCEAVDLTIPVGEVADVEVEAAADTVEVGATVQLTATAVDGLGAVLDVDVTWTSGDTSVATVDGTGLVSGVAEGQVVIEAAVDGVSGEAGITVVGEPTGTLTILNADTLRGPGDTLALEVEARAADGSVIADPGVVWSSRDPDIATVDSMGRVISKAIGTATIVASAVCCADDAAALTVEAGSPGTVDDLRVVAVSSDSVTVEWTQVDDGTGDPASYAVRYGSPTLSWGGAYGTEATVEGGAVGEPATHTFTGLDSGTDYEFALVAYRGTLNVDAEFGEISNVAGAHTPTPGEPNVTLSPTAVDLDAAGDTVRLAVEARRSDGSVVADPDVSWSSLDEGVATVDGAGLVTAVGDGATQVVAATGCCGSDTAGVAVGGGDPPPSGSLNEPAGMTVIGYADGSVAEADGNAFGWPQASGWYGHTGGGSKNVSVVDDPGNPTGSGKAVRFHWVSSEREAAIADLNLPSHPSEVYVRMRIVFESGWDVPGHKFYYLHPKDAGGNGPWTSHENSSSPSDALLRVIASGDVEVRSDNGTMGARDEEILIEWHWVAPSSPGASDGEIHVWIDGVQVGSSTDLAITTYDPSDTPWDNIHFYAHANTVNSDSYYRVREFYVSGK